MRIRIPAPLALAFRTALRAAARPVVKLLDGFDIAFGWLGRRFVRLFFPRGESWGRTAARPVRRGISRSLSRWDEPFFRPDETIAPDPLRPSARVVAAGLAQAFSRGVEGRPDGFRLLVCRAPGHAIEILLDATRRRCFVDVRPAAPDAPAHAEAALPPLAPGAAPMRFSVSEDNLRLVLRPTPAGVFALARGARFP